MLRLPKLSDERFVLQRLGSDEPDQRVPEQVRVAPVAESRAISSRHKRQVTGDKAILFLVPSYRPSVAATSRLTSSPRREHHDEC